MSVAAAIVDGDRVLAIRRRDNDKWEPPGGTLEPNETIVDGLEREVREELGIRISNPRLTGVYKNLPRGVVALVFRCDHNGEVPQRSSEVSEYEWLTKKEVVSRLDPAYACRLLDAFEIGNPAVRSHDGVEVLG